MDNIWQYHDLKLKELKNIYTKISKQTQNRLQEIFNGINFDFDKLYNIVDKTTKKRIDTYIEEWKEKKLLKGYFGMLANNIYRRNRVKNNEIIELLIYAAYIEEQSKIEKKELNIFKDISNYYYEQAQEEINETLPKNKRKIVSVIPDAIFLNLLSTPNTKGYIWNQYIEAIIKYNSDQIYRQVIIDIQQGTKLEINSDIYQNIIKKQQNVKLCINDDKISGAVDNEIIGINNLAKIEGYKNILPDEEIEVKFVAIEDEVTTKMCQSLNGQRFSVNAENNFVRYSESRKSNIKYKCKGLIIGLNLPPINDHFHYCRSTIIYVRNIEKKSKINYNNFELQKRIIKSLNKSIFKYNVKDINKVALLQNFINGNRVIKDFPTLKGKIKEIRIKSNVGYSMGITPNNTGKSYILRINKDEFKSIKNIRNSYNELLKYKDAPEGTSYKDIFTHEMGHATIYEIIKKRYKNNTNATMFDWNNNITANDILDIAFKNMNIINANQKGQKIKELSNYAYTTNSSEVIAEAFADYYSNRSKAKRISKEVINVMKGMI